VCGESRGGRYQHGGQWVCWPCSGLKPLEPPPVALLPGQQFRGRISDKLWALDKDRYWSLGDGHILGVCPVCRAGLPEYLSVRFHGRAARADLVCSLGCAEADLAAAFGLEVRP
jgi:hypothetical protein